MNKLITLFLFIALALPGYGQLGGGFKAGLNIANFVGSDADGSDPRIGYHVGGYLTMSMSYHFTFQPELLVSSAGSKTKESGYDPDLGDYSLEGNAQLTYISAPIMFAYNFNETISLQVGPQVSYLAAAKLKYDIKSDLINLSGSEDVKDQFNSVDFGLNFGVGFTFGLVTAAARYNLGLTEVPDESANVKNSVIQFSIGYKIVKK